MNKEMAKLIVESGNIKVEGLDRTEECAGFWNICSLAYQGCDGAKDGKMFQYTCSKNYVNCPTRIGNFCRGRLAD